MDPGTQQPLDTFFLESEVFEDYLIPILIQLFIALK